MTTSTLSHCSGELRDADLQTVRDFALEAPYEWRQVLEALVDMAEASDGHDPESLIQDLADANAKIEEQKESLERLNLASLVAVKQTRETLLEMRVLVTNVVVNTDAAKKVKEVLDSFGGDFTAALDELEATAHGEMSSGEQEEVEKRVEVAFQKLKEKKR